MNDNYGTDQFDVDKDELNTLSEVTEDEGAEDDSDTDLGIDSDSGSFGGDEDSDEAEVYNAIFEYKGYSER